MLHHHFGRIFQKRMQRKVWSCDAGQEDLKLKKKVKKKLKKIRKGVENVSNFVIFIQFIKNYLTFRKI
jgi:hypothetical protein